jgi:hypothetical protein
MSLEYSRWVLAKFFVHFLAMYLRCTGSGHHPLPPVIPITWELHCSPTDPPISPGTSPYRFDEDSSEEWVTAYCRHLNDVRPNLRNRDIGLEDDQRAFDELVREVMMAMEQASEETLKRNRFHPRASPWYTEEVAETIAEVRRQRGRVREATASTSSHPRRTGSTPSSPTPSRGKEPPTEEPPSPEEVHLQGVLREYRAATRNQRKVVQKAKRDWAMEFTSNVKSRDVWKLTSWYKGVRRQTAPPLNRPDGTKAITPEEKADTLFGSLFQPPPELEDEPGVDPAFPGHNTRTFVDVTEDEVNKALSATSNTSAPGRSGIGYRALKWIWLTRPREILLIMQLGLRLGVHHDLWKTATTVILPKPNKPSYSDPRAYRPIQLLECLGKILEKIVASRLSFDIGKHNLVPFEQFGGRSNSSCTDAGMSLVHDIESAWKHSQVVSVLAIDISRFFDNVNHKRLVRIVYEMGFPLPIVRWVSSFISNRKAAIRLDSDLSQPRPIEVGIPQGSPISPVLSVIYAAEVITLLKEASICTPSGIPLSPRSYVDDYAIMAISNSLHDNIATLSHGLESVVNTLARIGMTCDTSKLDLQHFTRRPSDKESPSLVVDVYGKRVTIAAPKSMRWLGIFFDRRLSFHEHAKIMAARAKTVINGLRCLGNTVRGLSQANM